MTRCPTCRRVIKRPMGEKRPRWDTWLPKHDAAIKERIRAGDHPSEIAAVLSARFPIPRTELAVRRRIRKLGVSTRDGCYSMDDVIRMLGTSYRVLSSLEASGDIDANAYGRWRRYRADDIDRLIREHAGVLFDPRRIRDPRLRSLAETSALMNRRRAFA